MSRFPPSLILGPARQTSTYQFFRSLPQTVALNNFKNNQFKNEFSLLPCKNSLEKISQFKINYWITLLN